MAELPVQDLTTVGAVAGMAGIGAIAAAEAAVLAAREFVNVGGGSYKFHLGELNSVISGWQGVVNTLTAAQTTVHTRAPHSPAVLEPGNENASTTVSDAAHNTNVAYQAHLKNTLQYAQGVLDHLTTARNNYLATEQNHTDAFRGLQA